MFIVISCYKRNTGMEYIEEIIDLDFVKRVSFKNNCLTIFFKDSTNMEFPFKNGNGDWEFFHGLYMQIIQCIPPGKALSLIHQM